jgi:hypothetical protein
MASVAEDSEDVLDEAVSSARVHQNPVDDIFCSKVSGKLRHLMDVGWYESDLMDPPFHESPSRQKSIEDRLESVEKTQLQIVSLLKELHGRLDKLSSSASSASSQMSIHASSSVPGSGVSSPCCFHFSCPLCSHTQHSPKSHCEHMRKVAQEKGECLLVAGTPDHDVILNLFGSPSSFVQWLVSYCVCGLIILSLL